MLKGHPIVEKPTWMAPFLLSQPIKKQTHLPDLH